MSGLISNLTIGILTFDQSTTYQKTISNLKKQKSQPEDIIIIKNIFPVSKAIFELVNKTKTEFVIILDDDMTFIDDDSLPIFVKEITNRNLDEIVFMLNDPIFGKIIGVRIYRTEKIKYIIDNLIISKDWDVDIHSELQKINRTLVIDHIIGNHHEEWTNLDLYWKMFTIAKKIQTRDNENSNYWIKRHINSLISIKENEQLIMSGFCGLVDGLRDTASQSFLSYENKFKNLLFEGIKKYVDPS